MQSLHEKMDHMGGKSALVAESRREVWQMGVSHMSRQILRHCPYCRHRKELPEIRREEAPLHVTRVPIDPKLPFSEIGIDLLGYLYVSMYVHKA